MTAQENRILNRAVSALEATAGVEAHVLRRGTGQSGRPGVIVDVKTQHRKHRFGVEVKTVDRFETLAAVRAKSARQPPLLVAPYITKQVAERCREIRLPFIDTAGNAYLERPGMLIYVVGQPRPAEAQQTQFRALTPAGLQIIFALLCDPELVGASYRRIAARAGVSLGAVGPVIQDLEARRFLRSKAGRPRVLLDPERVLEEWVAHYPATLRRKLNPRRFDADPERLQQIDVKAQNAYWGGEPAAQRLTQYLKPAQFTIYARDPITRLAAAGRMRAAEHGNVEILERFWHFEANPEMPEVVPPILAYADLVATHDSRNLEAARMIYEQRIVPAFRTAP